MRVKLLVLTLCFLGSVSILAQQRNRRPPRTTRPSGLVSHTIRGKVYLPDGRPVENHVRVSLRVLAQGVVRDAYTDSNGNFEFQGISNNNYELLVWGTEDFETTTESIEVFGNISRTVFRAIYLKPNEEDRWRRPKADVISVAELDKNIPKAARREYRRGVKAADKGQREKAIAHFQRAIEKYDRYFQAYNDLGVRYLEMGQLSEAQAAFVKAISIEPRVVQPHLNLGSLQIRQHQYEEAIATMTRALELDATDWRGHLWLGVGLMEARRDDTLAKEELEKALRLSDPPQGSIARLYLCNLYIRQGDLKGAIEQAEAYLREAPDAENAQAVREHIARMRARIERQTQPNRR